jgi:uncharacterized protein involved in high-affinity Fe2+ transport
VCVYIKTKVFAQGAARDTKTNEQPEGQDKLMEPLTIGWVSTQSTGAKPNINCNRFWSILHKINIFN